MIERRTFIKNAALGVAGGLFVGPHALPAQQDAHDQCASFAAPMEIVHGKVAFITGGSSGIGLGIARAFFEAGMKVILGYRTQENLDKALEHFKDDSKRVHAIKVDVVDRAAMSKAADESLKVFGKVHVLVNNAGVVHIQYIQNTTFDDWDWIMGVNLNGVFNGVRVFLPHIRAHGEGGQIVTTSSAAGLVAGYSSLIGAYSASKYAVVGLMEALRAELSDSNIGVSAFCPGEFQTNVMNSNRNRPTELRDTIPIEGQTRRLEPKSAALNPRPQVMDPLVAGKLVLNGIRRNDLYILTHAEYMSAIKARGEALIASAPVSSNGAGSNVNYAVYSNALDQRRCQRQISQ
jgi:NAD(P)-dependent dehydrogenase (short-subunit alcohol dehydrogenase family)